MKQHNRTSSLETIHKFPTESPVRDGVKAFMNMDSSKVQPFPLGHVEFPIPDNAKWFYSKLDGTFLEKQFDTPSVKYDRLNIKVTPIRFHHLVISKSTTSIWYQHWWIFKCGSCGKKFLGRKDRYVGGRLKSCGCLSQQRKRPQEDKDHMFKYNNSHIIQKAKKNETVEMFTGNVHKREGLVKVTIDDAYRVWDSTITLEEIIEKKKRMGDSYYDTKKLDEALQSREINRREKLYASVKNNGF